MITRTIIVLGCIYLDSAETVFEISILQPKYYT